MVKKLVLLSLLVVFSILPSVAKAAVLYLEPPSDYYHPGDTFIVEAKIDVEGECINLVGVDLNFSQDILEVVDFSQGSSILTFWIKSPTIDQKSELISFATCLASGRLYAEMNGAPSKPMFMACSRAPLNTESPVLF